MFICNECGELFDEPKTVEEHHPYGMTYATEYWAVCPNCEDTNYDEARRCANCYEYVASVNDDDLCEECNEYLNEEE